MGRHCSIRTLGPAKSNTVDQVIRAYRYIHLDDMVLELADRGIKIARSTLHRYLRALRERDMLCARPEEGTIVTIVERATGEVRVIKCCIASADLHAIIEANGPAKAVS